MQVLRDIPHTTSLCTRCVNAFSSRLGSADLRNRARDAQTPPTALEIDTLRSSLSQMYDDLRVCDRKIEVLESALSSLRRHRGLIASTATNISKLLSTIHMLPQEVLEQIAGYTLPSGWYTDDIGKRTWAFTQVCREWRKLALAMHWPWAHIRLGYQPYDGWWSETKNEAITDVVETYLQRSGQHPLTLVISGTLTSHSVPALWDALMRHAQRIVSIVGVDSNHRGYSYGYRVPLTVHFPTLRKLIHNGLSSVEIVAPNLRALDSYLCGIHPSWDNLRVLKTCGPLEGKRLAALRHCIRLEVLSLSHEFTYVPLLSEDCRPISFPMLQTLEVAWGAVEICPLLDVPELRHFILISIDCGAHYDWYKKLDLLWPVTHITLRNMHIQDAYPVSLLRPIIAIPWRLQKLSIVEETPPTAFDDGHYYGLHDDLLQTLCFDKAAPSFAYLSELEIITGSEGGFETGDLDIMRRILESRIAPPPGCTPLQRLSLKCLSSSYLYSDLEDWLRAQGRDDKRILNIISASCTRFVGPSDVFKAAASLV
ncbi:uncharacterized protein SCHCODRAFT_02359444 [Schizophyllum commune H4-8]|nr:uncharacterized protein SCHCODRAFT_02359444 [Schizophyllum commune H4-8]KAI5889098.1 hypothetical protein SCHCODRAFT_02359444 [Schizophyllum commune H4-8]